LTLLLPHNRWVAVTTSRRKVKHCIAAPLHLNPSALRPSPGFDIDNEEANVRVNVAVADGHADIRASAVMTDDKIDDYADKIILMTLMANRSGPRLLVL